MRWSAEGRLDMDDGWEGGRRRVKVQQGRKWSDRGREERQRTHVLLSSNEDGLVRPPSLFCYSSQVIDGLQGSKGTETKPLVSSVCSVFVSPSDKVLGRSGRRARCEKWWWVCRLCLNTRIHTSSLPYMHAYTLVSNIKVCVYTHSPCQTGLVS